LLWTLSPDELQLVRRKQEEGGKEERKKVLEKRG